MLSFICHAGNNISIHFDVLTRFGYKVLVASEGKSALEQAAYATPDLILPDVMMPCIGGLETCRQLKCSLKTQGMPVIFMTALKETDSKVNDFNMGAVDYVNKPFESTKYSLALEHTCPWPHSDRNWNNWLRNELSS